MGSAKEQRVVRKKCRKELKSVGTTCVGKQTTITMPLRASIQDDLADVSTYLTAIIGAVQVAEEIVAMGTA